MLKLFLVDSEQNRTVVPLLRSEITIGRAEGNTIRLTDQNISRVHARLVRTEAGYAIEDLSRYGVLGPNGPISGPTPIGSGESYRIGDYLLEFKEERASLPLPAARPKSPLPQPRSASTASSWGVTPPSASAAFTSIEAAPASSGEALITPAGTGTAVFVSDDIDAALSGFGGSATTEPAAERHAPTSPSADSGSSTAGSIAVEPEPVFAASRVSAAEVTPPAAPPATAPAAPALEAPADFFAVAKDEAPKPSMTLRPTSVQAMKLVGQTAPFSGAELHLTTPRIVLGSGSACDVVLEHAGIAPEHLALRYDGSSWWVDALSGQVRVDGDLVPTSKVWKGAVITMGGLDFRFAEPTERQSVRLAPVAAAAVAAPKSASAAVSDGVNEFDAEILKRGKRNQTIGIGVGVAAALGLMALLTVGGEDEAPAAAGSAETEVAATAPAAPAPKVEAAAGSGSGAAEGSGSVVAAVVDDAAAKAAAEAKAAEDAKAAAEAEKAAKVAAAAQAAADAKASAEAEKAAKAAAAAQAAADRKAAAEAAKAEKAAKAAQAAAERRAAAEAAKAAREAKAAEAARARAARAAAPPEPRAAAAPRAAAPAPTPARTAAAAPAKATPPAPFQEVAPAAAAEPAGPTAQSLIADAKRAAVQNNRRDAVKFLEQARRLDPKNAEVNQLLFSNYRALGNTLRASEAVKRYLALKPNDPKRSDYENWLEQNATP